MKIISGKKTIAVEYENGKKGLFSFDANNLEALTAWNEKAKALKDFDPKDFEGDELKAITDICKDVFVTVYGKCAFKTFWRKTNHSAVGLMQFIMETTELLKQSQKAFEGLKK